MIGHLGSLLDSGNNGDGRGPVDWASSKGFWTGETRRGTVVPMGSTGP